MRDISKITDLKPNPRNPRRITTGNLEGLKKSIKYFGDLSGIVFNIRTNQLVCGHQRIEVLKKEYDGKLKIEKNQIITPDSVFPIRIVDWDETTEKLANLAANNPALQGTFIEQVNTIIEEVKNDIRAIDIKIDEIKIEDTFDNDKIIKEKEIKIEDLDFKYTCPQCGYQW